FLLSASELLAQYPSLYITGLQCPGGEGEPATNHALSWQCRSAYNRETYHSWQPWQETVPIDYGDVVAVTWFDQCRAHGVDWDFLRINLVTTNQSGALQTNSSTVKMKAGYNFQINYIYWFTNNGSIFPTNF